MTGFVTQDVSSGVMTIRHVAGHVLTMVNDKLVAVEEIKSLTAEQVKERKKAIAERKAFDKKAGKGITVKSLGSVERDADGQFRMIETSDGKTFRLLWGEFCNGKVWQLETLEQHEDGGGEDICGGAVLTSCPKMTTATLKDWLNRNVGVWNHYHDGSPIGRYDDKRFTKEDEEQHKRYRRQWDAFGEFRDAFHNDTEGMLKAIEQKSY